MDDQSQKREEKPRTLLYGQEAYLIQGAVFEVYREMGCGFLEAVYQECLQREFEVRGIPYLSQKELAIWYKGKALNQYYKADLICYEKIILELKAVKELTAEHKAQLFNYLKATNLRLGLLVNFGHHPKVEIVRIVV